MDWDAATDIGRETSLSSAMVTSRHTKYQSCSRLYETRAKYNTYKVKVPWREQKTTNTPTNTSIEYAPRYAIGVLAENCISTESTHVDGYQCRHTVKNKDELGKSNLNA